MDSSVWGAPEVHWPHSTTVYWEYAKTCVKMRIIWLNKSGLYKNWKNKMSWLMSDYRCWFRAEEVNSVVHENHLKSPEHCKQWTTTFNIRVAQSLSHTDKTCLVSPAFDSSPSRFYFLLSLCKRRCIDFYYCFFNWHSFNNLIVYFSVYLLLTFMYNVYFVFCIACTEVVFNMLNMLH